MRDVTLQELSDCGLNPFAVQLLVESYRRHPRPVPVRFVFDGITFAIGFPPAELNKLQPCPTTPEQNSAPTPENQP